MEWKPIETLTYRKKVLFCNNELLEPWYRLGEKIQITRFFKREVIDAYKFDDGFILIEGAWKIFPTHWCEIELPKEE